MKKRVIISVISDLVTDQRVHKVSQTLHDDGFEVLLVGRVLPESLRLEPRDYQTKRMKLTFNRTALFYANYNIRLFFMLLFTKADVLLANDLDTLPSNYLASVIKGIPVVYDSHEYYTGVPELRDRPFVRGVWERIERLIFPRLKKVYTVNNTIAQIYHKKYHKDIGVVRNVPFLLPDAVQARSLPQGKKTILYQGGGINIDRGCEELVLAMKYLSPLEYQLQIVGGGDVIGQLKSLAARQNLSERIEFVPKVPFQELYKLTKQADLGICIDKPNNLNYLYSLPNKIFEYIHAGLPALCSALPEIKAVVDKYGTGAFIDRHDPEHIAERIRFMFEDPDRYLQWRTNCLAARKELCWQKEGKTVSAIFHPYLGQVD